MALQRELDEKRKELDEKRKELDESHRLIDSLRLEVTDARRDLRDCEKASGEHVRQVASEREMESQAAANAIRQLKAELYSMAHQLKKSQSKLSRCEEEWKGSVSEGNAWRAKISDLQLEKGQLLGVVQTLEAQSSQTKQLVSSLQSEVFRLSSQDGDLRRRLEEQAIALREMDAQNNTNTNVSNSKLREMRLQQVTAGKQISEVMLYVSTITCVYS